MRFPSSNVIEIGISTLRLRVWVLPVYSQKHINKLCAINFKLLYSQNSKITNNDIDKNDIWFSRIWSSAANHVILTIWYCHNIWFVKYAAYLYDIDYTWSESATEINDNRSFWSTSVETYDEKFSRKKIYCTKRCALKFKGSPWGQFLNTTTREEGQYQNADFVFKKMRTSCLKKCGLWQVGCQRHNPNTVNLPVICYC